jgi:hypothetical protein
MANQMAVALAKSSQTPPLKLMPGEGFQGNPTDRGLIQSFHEELEPGEYRSSEDQPLSLCFQGVGPPSCSGLTTLHPRPPWSENSARGLKVPRPHVDDDSKSVRSMLNANDLRFYTATPQFIVDDSPVSSSGTHRLPPGWISSLTGGCHDVLHDRAWESPTMHCAIAVQSAGRWRSPWIWPSSSHCRGAVGALGLGRGTEQRERAGRVGFMGSSSVRSSRTRPDHTKKMNSILALSFFILICLLKLSIHNYIEALW